MDINITFSFRNRQRQIKTDLVLVSILVFAAILRFYHIGYQAPWLDELSTLMGSDPDITFAETDRYVLHREGFPHLYFLSLKFLSTIFGHSIVVLRVFSAAFGVATVYFLFLFVKNLFNKRAAYIAAILISVNLFHIYHSQEARAYALLVFFVIFASYRMVMYIREPTTRNAIYLGIACGLIPNAHPLGVLNIGVIYGTLLAFLLMQVNKKQIFRQLSLSGLITLLVFIPVYKIISKVSDIKSFWIPEASLANLKQAFLEMFGSSDYIFYIYISAAVLFFPVILYKISKEKGTGNQLQTLSCILIAVWLTINIGVIVVKSYAGISIILNRYFIGSLCAFIIALAYLISQIRNKYVSGVIVLAFVCYSLFTMKQKSYYTAVSKAQFNLVAKEIVEKNTNRDKVYSAYAYVSSTLFKGSPSYELLKEITFEDYLNSVKNNTIEKEPFWYFDGNFRPYSLSAEDQLFLETYYTMDIQIDKYDCWARHYVVKGAKSEGKPKEETVSLLSFNPKTLDNEGHLLMFQNGSISTKPLFLKEGEYQLVIEANSLPEKPIDGENAHINVKLNDAKISASFLSEKKEDKKKVYSFKVTDKGLKILSISFDNDVARDGLDRNVIIYSIALKNIGG